MDQKMPSFLADALSTAAELGRRAGECAFLPRVHALEPTEDQCRFLMHLDGRDAATITEVPRPRKVVIAELATLPSFCDFLSKPHAALSESGVPLVTVERAQVAADYNPDGHFACHRVQMPLEFSESFQALREIMGMPRNDADGEAKGSGVTQKRLWVLLATELQRCFPEEHEYVISQLSHYEKSATKVSIARSGIGSVDRSATLELRWETPTGEQKSEIEIDWTYVGPVWTCFDLPIEIPLRLVISSEDGLRFRLYARGLEALLLQHRAALANQLTAELAANGANIPVYEGCLLSG